MKTYGYARCSTNEDKQDINRQIRELKAAGADEVVFEYEHGDAKVKKELHMLLDMAASGDTIITLEVSRLSRSTQQLCEILDIVKEKHLRLMIVGSITIDCRNGEVDPMSKAFLEMSGVFAELELSMIRARPQPRIFSRRPSGQPDYYTTYPMVCQEVFEKFFNFFAVFFAGLLAVSLHIIALLFLFVKHFWTSFFSLELSAFCHKNVVAFLCIITNPWQAGAFFPPDRFPTRHPRRPPI